MLNYDLIQDHQPEKISLNTCTIVHFYSKSDFGKVNFLIDLGHCQTFKQGSGMNCETNAINLISLNFI